MAAGMAFYASGIGGDPVCCVMRRAAGINSLGAGVAADELVNPAFGFSAPNRGYPTTADVRGLLGHLVYGLRSPERPKDITAFSGLGRPDHKT